MEAETLKTIFLLLIAAGVCAALHWLVGIAQRRVVRRIAPPPPPAAVAPPSLKRLLLDWTGNALRTLIWVLYFAFLINVLPHTRTQFENLGERLMRVRGNLARWLLDPGINLVIIIVVTVFLMRFASALIKAIFHLFERGAMNREELATRRRLQTLSATFRGISQAIILFIGLMVFLRQLGADITPILASAGVVGIAIGLGAQSLIKDFFAGLLILLEDQLSVGDSVKIGETSGTVEHLTLRVTRVRGLDGSLTMIPNGSIGAVVNYSKDWSRAVLDIEIDYKEDVDRAMKVMLETAKRMREEAPAEIIEEPVMLGVDRLGNSGVTLRLLAKTAASKQAEVGRELRRRIKLAFDEQGIKTPSPTPQLVLTPPPQVKKGEELKR
ncbi:MAG: hypothetical protein JMDDDDMK_05058 [Acidobacteria bacterium]|nr:hypothetical protein [Acidobacteriota bacterium]